MNSNELNYYAEVHDSEGIDERLDSNINFKKLSSTGIQLGCFLSSMELRGFFSSVDNKTPQKNSKEYPLLTHPFIDFIESHDLSSFNLIEFGSGNSTIFFEKIFNKIISFENNLEWFEKIKLKISKVNYNFITTEDMEEGLFHISTEDCFKSFVLIDSACNRLKIAKNIANKYNPAFIILDNSEWYRNTASHLSSYGYMEIPFWGFKNTEHWESCTSLFINLNNIHLLNRNTKFPPPLARKIINNWDK